MGGGAHRTEPSRRKPGIPGRTQRSCNDRQGWEAVRCTGAQGLGASAAAALLARAPKGHAPRAGKIPLMATFHLLLLKGYDPVTDCIPARVRINKTYITVHRLTKTQ